MQHASVARYPQIQELPSLWVLFSVYVPNNYAELKSCGLQVRAELKALFTADCVRRLATEVLLPWLMQRANAATHGKEARPKSICMHISILCY